MSKAKQVELEESALFVAEKLLAVIEHEVDLLDKQNKAASHKRLESLVKSFQQLRPFF